MSLPASRSPGPVLPVELVPRVGPFLPAHQANFGMAILLNGQEAWLALCDRTPGYWRERIIREFQLSEAEIGNLGDRADLCLYDLYRRLLALSTYLVKRSWISRDRLCELRREVPIVEVDFNDAVVLQDEATILPGRSRPVGVSHAGTLTEATLMRVVRHWEALRPSDLESQIDTDLQTFDPPVSCRGALRPAPQGFARAPIPQSILDQLSHSKGRKQALHTLAHFGCEMSEILQHVDTVGLIFTAIALHDFKPALDSVRDGRFHLEDGSIVDSAIDSPTLWEVLHHLRQGDIPPALFAQNILRLTIQHRWLNLNAEHAVDSAMAFAVVRNTGLSLKETLTRTKPTQESYANLADLGASLKNLKESSLDESLKQRFRQALLRPGKARWLYFQRFINDWDHIRDLFVNSGLLTEDELIECAPTIRLPDEWKEILIKYGPILARLRQGPEPVLSKEEVVRLINCSWRRDGIAELEEYRQRAEATEPPIAGESSGASSSTQ